jgi:hypothetical protein
LGFDSSGNIVFDSGFIPGNADGAAVGFGALAGNIFVNTNSGTVVEVNLSTLMQTTIADGGSRGDLVSVDPFDSSLFITQTDRVMRLSGPVGSGFGPNPVPEPASMALFGIGVLGLVAYAWRKKRAGDRNCCASRTRW